MAEQHGNALYGHASEQQLHGERMPETVRMPTPDFRESEKFFQAPLPVSHGALELPLAGPEKILLARAADDVESLNHGIGKRTGNQRARFGRVETQHAARDPHALQTYRVADPQTGVAQQKHQSAQSPPILLARSSVVVAVDVARGQSAQPLFAREGENLRRARFLTFEFCSRVVRNPSIRLSEAEERPQRFELFLRGEILILPGCAKLAQRRKVQLADKPQAVVTRKCFDLLEQELIFVDRRIFFQPARTRVL